MTHDLRRPHDPRLDEFRAIIADATDALPGAQRDSTNMYLDTNEHAQGELVGPAPQNIRAKHTALVVFVDENPLANFAHECRYRFYDRATQRFLYEIPAQFPPWVNYVPKSYFAIYGTVGRDVRDAQRGERHDG